MAPVIIGVDPHKRSAAIEIINDREQAVGQGRFGTDRDSYKAMLAAGRKHKDRAPRPQQTHPARRRRRCRHAKPAAMRSPPDR